MDPTFRERLRVPRFRQLYDHWHALRGRRAMPAREDIDPLAMKELLGWLLLIDVERAPLRFRFRLVGTEIVAVRGRDLTGRYLDEAVGADDIILRLNTRVATDPSIGFHCALDTMHDATAGWIYRLSLPLSRNGRDVDMILGGFAYEREACKPPEMFERIPIAGT